MSTLKKAVWKCTECKKSDLTLTNSVTATKQQRLEENEESDGTTTMQKKFKISTDAIEVLSIKYEVKQNTIALEGIKTKLEDFGEFIASTIAWKKFIDQLIDKIDSLTKQNKEKDQKI